MTAAPGDAAWRARAGPASMRSGPRSTARGVVADERRERSLHGAMLLIVERNGVMEAESS